MNKKFLGLFLIALTLSTKATAALATAAAAGGLCVTKFVYDSYSYNKEQRRLKQTPLHTFDNHRAGYLRDYIRKGVPINAQNIYGQTALHTAAKDGRCSVLQALLKHGATVNMCDNRGNTALIWVASRASNYGHFECVKALLASGAEVTIANDQGRTPLHYTVSEGGNTYHFQCVQLLVQRGAHVTHADNEGVTPLHWANGKDCVEFLLNHGADIYAVTNLGNTPLHIAAQSSFPVTITTLLAHDAQVNATNNFGQTPLDCALAAQQEAFAQKENDDLVKKTSECIQILLKHGATSGAHLVAKNETLQLQLAHDQAYAPSYDKNSLRPFFAQCNLRTQRNDKEENRPESSVSRDSKEREKEEDKDEPESSVSTQSWHHQAEEYHMTPLHRAAQGGNLKLISTLISHGSNVNVFNLYQMTPLHFAVYHNHSECVQELICAGRANVNTPDDQGLTPLHYAVIQNNVECLCMLLSYGRDININAVDTNQQTPLDLALSKGHEACAEALIAYSLQPVDA